MWRSQSLCLSAVLLFAAISPGAWPDAIKLDSGKTIEGTVVQETSGVLQVNAGGVTIRIPRARIVSITASESRATTGAVEVERLDELEKKGLWSDLYDAAGALLVRETSNTVALDKQRLAAGKIREALGGKGITELARQGRFDEAITSLTERLREIPLGGRAASTVGRRFLAEIYLARARNQMANSLEGHVPLTDARKARELDPSSPDVDYVEGTAQMKLQNFDQAAALLERAIRAARVKDFRSQIQLMTCYRHRGDFDKILRLCDAATTEAVAAAETWPEVRAMLGEASLYMARQWAAQGKTTEAAAAYEKYLSFSERTPEQLHEVSAFFERIGNRERAQSVLTEHPRVRSGASGDTTVTLTTIVPLP